MNLNKIPAAKLESRLLYWTGCTGNIFGGYGKDFEVGFMAKELKCMDLEVSLG